jgi:hypothetical protein
MKFSYMAMKAITLSWPYISLLGANPIPPPNLYPGKKNLLPFIVPLQATLL